MDRNERNAPVPPFFEFSPTEEGWAFVFDEPGHIHQLEAPEFEERGPDFVFDSWGRLAELGVEDYFVTLKRWSEQPKMDMFDKFLRAAAVRYLPGEDIGALGTFELRDRLETVLRQRQRAHTPLRRLATHARNLWRSASRRSG